jgi:hypothetical protein
MLVIEFVLTTENKRQTKKTKQNKQTKQKTKTLTYPIYISFER